MLIIRYVFRCMLRDMLLRYVDYRCALYEVKIVARGE